MKRILLCFLLFLSLPLLRAQTMTPAPYCTGNFASGCAQPGPSNAPGNLVNDFINSFITFGGNANISNLNTGCFNMGTGYIYYCNKYLGAMPGNVITCSIQIGIDYSQGIAIFVDWNQDNSFNMPAERIGTSAVIPGGTWTTITFTVPPGQANGTYRMRARCARMIPGNFINPCNLLSEGETEDYNIIVGIPAPGPISINASTTTLCAGTNVTLTASGTGPFTWSNGFSGVNSYTSPLANTVVYVSQPNGNCVSVNAVSLTVLPNPTVSALSSTNQICFGNNATLTANGASTYTWYPGALSGSNVVVSPTVNTSYTVIGSSLSCTNSAVLNVLVGPNLFAYPVTTLVCSGSPAMLSAVGCTSYTWMPGNLNGPTIVVNPTVTSNYTVTGTNNGCSRTVTVTQNVAPLPIINATVNTNPSCEGTGVILSATGGNTFTWNPGALVGASVIVSPTIQTIYTVTGNDGTCSATALHTQSIILNPIITASTSMASICSGNSVTLSASGAPFYLWSNGSASSSISVSPAITTGYTVTGISGICTASAIVIQSVVSTPTVIGISSSSLLCSGDAATLSASGASNYSWMPSGSGNSIVITPSTSSTYTIIGANGPCTSSTSITQSVVICTSLKEQVQNSKLMIYPMPFSDELMINSKKFIQIFIYDSKGEKVLEAEGNGSIIFDTGQWSRGIYFLKAIDSIESKNYKLIKN